MRKLLLIVLLLIPTIALGQARTAERIVSVPFSQLAADLTAPNGSVRHVINGLEGTSPCAAGGSGAWAIKINGVWQCPKVTAGTGTGDVLGTSSSSVGEMVLYSTTTGRNIGRSNTLSGIPLLTLGVVSTLASSGTGDVARVTGPAITGMNASTAFGSGTIPAERVISSTIINARCLRVSNVGTIEVAAADCGIGGGGSPGGVSGNLTFNEASSFGGASNTSYDSVTGRLVFSQKANSNDTLNLQRATDSSPTGTLLRARNAANSADLFAINANGSVFAGSTITIANTAAPSTPSAGNTVLWTDVTGKNLRAQDDAGNVSGTVRAITCSGTDKISAISSSGVPTCTADQGSAGTGVITFNTLNASDQTVATVDDTNIDLTWASSVSTHTLTAAWVGRLDAARMDINTVLDNVSNTWSTGAQSFAAATSLTVPSAAGASPTASGNIAYDSTSGTWEGGVSGTNRTFAFTTGSQTFSDKTLDNSNVATLRDTNLTIVDGTDVTKAVQFEVTNVGSGTTRFITVPNANTVTVQPSTLTTDQVVTHIDSSGVQQKAQLAFSQLTGSILATQGGTNQTAVAQGDLLFGSATNTWSRLAKSTTATHALLNTGASNNPQWGQVPLATGVTGTLPVANWSVLTTKGDLMGHNGTTTVRHAVGTDGQALFADSTQTNGVRWGAVTASAGGSTTQLQRNNAGALAGISGATSDGTSVTFGPANLIVSGQAATPTAVLGAFYVDTDTGDKKLYFAFDSSGTPTWGEVFISGLSVVNLASANVTGVLPLANGGTNQASWTASRCVQVNSAGTALESAAAACGSGGSITGSDTHVLFFDGANTPAGEAGFTYNKTTDTATLAGGLVLSASGAGYIELAEGSAPTVVANRITIAAGADVPAGGLLYLWPTDTPTNGEQLTANISGTTVTLSWDASGSGGSGDAVSVNGSAATDANFVNTAASGTVPSITWALNTGATPDEVSISAIGAASLTEAGVLTTGTQGIAGIKILGHSTALGRLGQTFEITTSANYGGMAINTFSTTAAEAGTLDFNRSKSATKGTQTVVAADDPLGHIAFRGSDGTDFENSVGILAFVDGTPGNNDMPGRLSFWTTPDGSATTAERWRITSNGHLLAATDNTVDIGATGATRPRDIFVAGTLNAQASGGGYFQMTEGAQPSLVANTVQHAVVTDAPAGGIQYLWGATAGSGILRVANSSGTMTVTQDAGISHLASSTSADLRGALSDETGTGAAVFVAGNIGAGTATTASANDNTTLIATTAYVQTELTAYASDSKTFTNTTYDPSATGNVFTSTFVVEAPAAGCNGSTASSFWDLPTATPAVAACVTGTNTQKAYLDFADTSGGFSAQYNFRLAADFTGTIDAHITWLTTATSGNVEWSLSTICVATDATETDDPAFNTASTVVTAAPGVASRLQTSTITSVTITGCAAGEWIYAKIFRDGNDAQDTLSATARLKGVQFVLRRAQ